MAMGNRALIDALLVNFDADLSPITLKKLTAMHCAAQQYSGYISMLIMAKEYG